MNAKMTKNILILGGSTEAFSIAEQLQSSPKYSVITSFAGRTSIPRKPAGNYRTGGFGGPEGLANYIKSENIYAIIDATHPFARKMTESAFKAANLTNCPILHIWRPAWRKQQGDNWIEFETMEEAAKYLNKNHSPAFLTIGRLELNAFQHRTDLSFLCRAIEPPKFTDPIKHINKIQKPTDQSSIEKQAVEILPENFNFIYAKGPFTYIDEKQLIEKENIKAIITKNSGGQKARAKLDVARELNIPVIMINRPTSPKGQTVETAEEAIHWLENL